MKRLLTTVFMIAAGLSAAGYCAPSVLEGIDESFIKTHLRLPVIVAVREDASIDTGEPGCDDVKVFEIVHGRRGATILSGSRVVIAVCTAGEYAAKTFARESTTT